MLELCAACPRHSGTPALYALINGSLGMNAQRKQTHIFFQCIAALCTHAFTEFIADILCISATASARRVVTRMCDDTHWDIAPHTYRSNALLSLYVCYVYMLNILPYSSSRPADAYNRVRRSVDDAARRRALSAVLMKRKLERARRGERRLIKSPPRRDYHNIWVCMQHC